MLTAWSTLTVDTSPEPRPSLSTCTRAPSRPRMIGRPTPGPKLEVCTPGRPATVSPSVPALASSSLLPASTSTGAVRFSAVSASGVACTSTAARSLGMLSCRACWGASAALAAGDSANARAAASAARGRVGEVRGMGLCEDVNMVNML